MTVKQAVKISTLKKVADVMYECRNLQTMHTPKMIFDDDSFIVQDHVFKFQVNEFGIVYALYYKKWKK